MPVLKSFKKTPQPKKHPDICFMRYLSIFKVEKLLVRIPRKRLQVFEFINRQMFGGGGKILHGFLGRDNFYIREKKKPA